MKILGISINLFDLDIHHCTGCVACVTALLNGKGSVCTQKDDFE